MQKIKSIKNFLTESEDINEAKSPFYDSADAIKAIVSSDMVASKMKMQPISKIALVSSDGKTFNYSQPVYKVHSSGSPSIMLTVKLEKSTPTGDKYGDNATYKVTSVEATYGTPG